MHAGGSAKADSGMTQSPLHYVALTREGWKVAMAKGKTKKVTKQTKKVKHTNSKAAAKRVALGRIKQGAKEGKLTEPVEAKTNAITPLVLVLIAAGVAIAYFLAEYLKTL